MRGSRLSRHAGVSSESPRLNPQQQTERGARGAPSRARARERRTERGGRARGAAASACRTARWCGRAEARRSRPSSKRDWLAAHPRSPDTSCSGLTSGVTSGVTSGLTSCLTSAVTSAVTNCQRDSMSAHRHSPDSFCKDSPSRARIIALSHSAHLRIKPAQPRLLLQTQPAKATC